MSAHTPGPWVVLSARTLHHVKGADGSLVGSIDNDANARLIAAAPDMLAALRTAEHVLSAVAAVGVPQAIEFARAAIAKATGAQ